MADYQILPISIKLLIIGQAGIILSDDCETDLKDYFGWFRGDSDRRPYLIFIENFDWFVFAYGRNLKKYHYINITIDDRWQQNVNYLAKLSEKCNLSLSILNYNDARGREILQKIKVPTQLHVYPNGMFRYPDDISAYTYKVACFGGFPYHISAYPREIRCRVTHLCDLTYLGFTDDQVGESARRIVSKLIKYIPPCIVNIKCVYNLQDVYNVTRTLKEYRKQLRGYNITVGVYPIDLDTMLP